MIKRGFDFVVSFVGLVVLAPVLAVIALLVMTTSRGPVLFRQPRVGRRFRTFFICKFRTMVSDSEVGGRQITVRNDPRITRVGRLLRWTKLDELPQLFNVLKGDMSLVGPRPEVQRYVAMYQQDYREILELRPGITDLASLKYHDEASVLALAEDAEEEYVRQILPEKIALAKEYIQRASFWFDLRLILRTIGRVVTGR